VKDDRRVTIAVDAMGGDHAPGEIVKGAVMAARENNLDIALVGPYDVIRDELSHYDTAGLPIRCVQADDVIKEGKDQALAARRKPDASIAVAIKLLKEGEADALISAGPTGAVVACGIRYLGMIPGIERPVIGGAIFDDLPNTVVFDCGVNMDCKPYQLLTFALIGATYCRKLLNIDNPAVGLINIGAEAEKGNQLTRETYRLLSESSFNFIGNVEGNHIMSGEANVLVCDAFVGNVLFKFVESIGMLHDTAGRENGADLGGGIIWGVNGLVRKLHGASRAEHVALKIHHARLAVQAGLVDTLKSDLHNMEQEIKPLT
jgi:glycerol-3-phosphate acyltransferase PlsX